MVAVFLFQLRCEPERKIKAWRKEDSGGLRCGRRRGSADLAQIRRRAWFFLRRAGDLDTCRLHLSSVAEVTCNVYGRAYLKDLGRTGRSVREDNGGFVVINYVKENPLAGVHRELSLGSVVDGPVEVERGILGSGHSRRHND